MENQDKERNPKMNLDQDPERIQKQNEWHDHADTDKYLAMEQTGVTYTEDRDPTFNADHFTGHEQQFEYQKYNPSGENSRNADAFSQDDYILNDNLDLDEDQNTSISSDEKER